MPARRSWRVLWVTLIPMLVFPLYGISCNPRSCPPAAEPCQRYVWSTGTGECVLTDIGGASCDYQGSDGICYDGECLPAECAGISAFGVCDRGDGSSGICMDFQCVAAEPEDPCVKPGVGRINCCKDTGCSVTSGAYCNNPVADGISCDPTGIEPWGQAGQDGFCLAGACVATTGLCEGLPCPTIWEEQCARDYCNPQTGECQEWWVDADALCLSSTANLPGFCRNKQCVTTNDDQTCSGIECVSDPCVTRRCIYPCAEEGDKVCDPLDYFQETPTCKVEHIRENGERCDGVAGICIFGQCALAACLNDSECDDDNNPCTEGACGGAIPGTPASGLCGVRPVENPIPCGEDDGQVLARCGNGQCLPDLCLTRDCSDGDSCTDDVCDSPYGVCSNPTKANGEPCDGEPGECIFGNCALGACTSDADCDDENSCTVDDCDPFGGLCSNNGLPSGSPCETSGGASGECRFGRCQPVFGGF